MNMGLIERIKALILKPQETFESIKVETSSIRDLYSKYVVILAAIPVLAGFVGSNFLAPSFLRISLINSFLLAVITYVLALVGLYLTGRMVNYLLPSFAPRKDLTAVMKLLVYSATPMWLAGVFSLLPQTGILSILGFYSLYLLYVGVPILLEVPSEKTILFTFIILVVAIVVMIVLNALLAPLTFSLIRPLY